MAEELNQKKTTKNKGIVNPSPPDDEVEETYMYDVRKPMAFLNESGNDVFNITKQTGINTAKSVFDRGATFRTS